MKMENGMSIKNILDNIVGDNKKIANFIKWSKKWYEKKVEQGWEETEFGLLSPEEIKDSGMVKQQDGSYAIPIQERIAESKSGGHRKGEKYITIDDKFMRWNRKRNNNVTNEDHIHNETQKQIRDDDLPEVNIDDIPF